MMRTILTLASKDLKLLFRDKFALFWVFAFPLMYALFFGSIFGDGGGGARGGMSIAIVDEDGGAEAASLIERLSEHDSVRVQRVEDTEEIYLHDLEEASALVRKGKKLAYIRIPEGYGASPFALFGGGEESVGLEVGIDPSRSAEAGFLQGILMETVFGGMAESFSDKDRMRSEIARVEEEIHAADDMQGIQKLVLTNLMGSLGEFFDQADFGDFGSDEGDGSSGGAFGGFSGMVEMVEVSRQRENEPRTAYDITFPSAMIWGLMGVAITFAITLVRERTQGTLLRLSVAPMGRFELLAGKALGCFATCMIVMVFLMSFGSLALGIRFESVGLAFVSMICTSLCFTGLMMTAAVMGKTEEAVGGAAWGVMMPFAMVGGGMIPLIAMPPWLAKASSVSPFKWGIVSMEGAVWRGFTLTDMLLPWAVLIGFGLAFFGIGLAVFKKLYG